MEYNTAEMGSCRMVNRIANYEILYYEDMPDKIEDIKVIFEDGIILHLDESYLDYVKEAKEKELVVDIDYSVSARRESWKDKDKPQTQADSEESAHIFICPKCKGRCIKRFIGKSKVYDCQSCKDQISSEAILIENQEGIKNE